MSASAFCILAGLMFMQSPSSETLNYQKKESWQASYQASLEQSRQPILQPWQQVAPFDPILRRPQLPETEPSPESTYPLFGGGKAGWKEMADYRDGYPNAVVLSAIDPKILTKEPTLCLGRTIVSDRDREMTVYLGADRGFSLWLNGEPVFYTETILDFVPGQEKVGLTLKKGENRLVLKLKIATNPARFFFMPELGELFAEQLLSRLHRDFGGEQEPVTDYRERARMLATYTEDESYPITELPVPAGIFLEGGGMDFLPDGRLAVSTRRGYVYLVSNATAKDVSTLHFHRFAQGLHEGLGLKVVDGQVYVVERSGLTRLLDTDGDNVADRFENLCNEWGLTGNYHEYAYGLDQDRDGNFYVALNVSFIKGADSPVPYRGWVVQVRPDGTMAPFCYGFRSPNGMGTNAEGDVFVTDNQGDWVPASPLYHLRKDHFYGHPASIRWTREAQAKGWTPTSKIDPGDLKRTPPAVWMPYEELAQSATDVVCDQTAGKFGPFADQLFVGDMTKGTIVRVHLEKVQGTYQGSCYLFRRGCGAVNRMTFGPDGRLYLSRVNRGWGGGGLGEGIARIEYTGKLPFEIHHIRLRPDGFDVHLTKPLHENQSIAAGDIQIERFRYNNWGNYGSPKIDRKLLAVTDVQIAADRNSLHVAVDGLQAGYVCQLLLPHLQAEDGSHLLHPEAFYTINHLVD